MHKFMFITAMLFVMLVVGSIYVTGLEVTTTALNQPHIENYNFTQRTESNAQHGWDFASCVADAENNIGEALGCLVN